MGVSTLKKTSYEEPSELELKPIPPHLEYAFLAEGSKLPVIINSSLTPDKKQRLVNLLRHHKEAIAWQISDIKGISATFCTHKILMEQNFRPVVQP